MNAIPVLSLAMCMAMDVVFPVNEKRCHQNCWAGALVANLLATLGVARLRVASRYAHRGTEVCMPGSSNVASKVAARSI